VALKKQLTRPDMEDVKVLFEHWRSTRQYKTTRIPKHLWEAAAALAGQYSVHKISRALRLNHSELRDQVAQQNTQDDTSDTLSAFIELPSIQRPHLSECQIEMENRLGEKMRMHFSGEVNFDFLALSANFWARRS
jgi:hypothetical protein